MDFADWVDEAEKPLHPSPRVLVLDVENTVFFRPDKSKDISPYHANNRLVSCGWGWVQDGKYTKGAYRYFYHNDLTGVAPDLLSLWRDELQQALDSADLVVAHNAKHDLSWLLECGYTFTCPVWDTMVAEYLLLRGQKSRGLSLADVAAHRGVYLKKGELIEGLWKQGIQFDAMPMDTVTEYGEADVRSCAEVFISQQKEYLQEDTRSMIPLRDMTFEFTRVLIDIERAGIQIDLQTLAEVEHDLIAEKERLTRRCQEIVFEVMGDRPINLSSPEQLSWVIYSRKLNDKKQWAERFNIGKDERGKDLRRPKLPPADFAKAVRQGTTQLRKQKASQCPACEGKGMTQLRKKDGSARKNMNICHPCSRTGLVYTDLQSFAGFKLSPRDVEDVSANGFGTNKETLERLIYIAEDHGNTLAVEFLKNQVRLNAVEAYLDNFVGGIRRGILPCGTLHPKLNQCVTATARLSSSEPNFQNLPRGGTLPLRRAIVSRWAMMGGEIIEADYSGLEFIVAGELSDDPVIAEMKRTGEDPHKKTATIIHCITVGEVSKEMRQQAKSHSFAPLFGAMGFDLPEHIRRYYQEFPKTYPGVGAWHKALQDEAIRKKKLVLPDGRQFAFPHARRTGSGGASGATMIKNYPVQSSATGTIVPLAVIRLWRSFQQHGLKSLIVNTVHDSAVVDRHPDDDRDLVLRLMYEAFAGIKPELKVRFGWDFKLPLDVEIEAGPNWMDKAVIPHKFTLN